MHCKTKQHKCNDLTVLKMVFKKDDYDEDDNETEKNYVILFYDIKKRNID